jgi:Tol biopolymer transport system component
VSDGTVLRLTTEAADDTTPSYSRDGQWVYFTSLRTGRPEIWKLPAGGGKAVQLTWGDGGWVPMESARGDALYYCHELPEKGIWKLPFGGKAVKIAGAYAGPLCGLAITKDGIYYTAPPNSRHWYSIQFVSFATGQTRPLLTSERQIGPLSLSISNDGRFLLYVQRDQAGSDLMLARNFMARARGRN